MWGNREWKWVWESKEYIRCSCKIQPEQFLYQRCMRQNNGRDSHFCGWTTFHDSQHFFVMWYLSVALEWIKKKRTPKSQRNDGNSSRSSNNENWFQTFSRHINENVQKFNAVDFYVQNLSVSSIFLLLLFFKQIVNKISSLVATNKHIYTISNRKIGHTFEKSNFKLIESFI